MRHVISILLVLSLVGSAQAVDLSGESLASVHVGDSVTSVQQRLGKALKATRPKMGQATGMMESTLEYPHLEIGMGDNKVMFVQATSPSTYGTSRHVHIGDDASRALAAYGKLDQLDEPHDIVLNFVADHGHIVKIYLGAGPE